MERFLNNVKTNWQRFIVLLASGIVRDFMKPLTDDSRKDVFIVDDSLFDRSRSKKTELLARVFDHCSTKFKCGYRMLTLGWSDGNSFVPVDYCLLSAADDKNLLCDVRSYDGRSPESQLAEFSACFIEHLPNYMQEALSGGKQAA